MGREDLTAFLIEAKKNTYAKSGDDGGKELKTGAKEYTHESAPFRYRDRYYGYASFLGEEIVWWYDDQPIWAMNYHGWVISNNLAAGYEVYPFLQRALCRIPQEAPFRGPLDFTEDSFTYINRYTGSIDHFTGIERILLDKQEVYRLYYHGGILVGY